MKSSKTSRAIDEFGRISLPVDMRRIMGLSLRDTVNVECDGETIIISKQERVCVFCASTDDLVEMSGKCICKECIKKLSQQ